MKPAPAALLILTLAAAAARARDAGPSATPDDVRQACGEAYRVLCAGTIAYAAIESGIDVIDFANPERPWRLGHIQLKSPARDLALAGDILVVADGDAGVVLIDVSRPEAPSVRGALAGFPARAVAAAADRAYVGEGSEAAGSDGALHVIDIANPFAPEELGVSSRLANGATAVLYEDGYAYVALGAAEHDSIRGVAVIDVSIPLVPVEVAFVATPEVPHSLAGGGGRLWIALSRGGEGALRGLDVTLPVAPALAGYLPLGYAARSLAVDGASAYVALGDAGLAEVDLSNPYAPALASVRSTGRTTCGVGAVGGTVLLGERDFVAPAAVVGAVVGEATAPAVTCVLSRDALRGAEAMNADTVPELAKLSR